MKSKRANLKKEVKGPMKMKRGGYLEPDKELMFGGPKKYQSGDRPTGMGPTAGRQANYGSRNPQVEAENKELFSYLTTSEKLSMTYNEKLKLAKQRQAEANKDKKAPAQASAPKATPPSQKQTGSADYPRGGIGTPKAATTSGTQNVGRPTQTPPPAAPKPAAPKPQSKGSSSFNQAFAAARKEGKTTFTWNGKSYGTRRADENQEQYKAAMARATGSSTSAAAPERPAPAPAPAPMAPKAIPRNEVTPTLRVNAKNQITSPAVTNIDKANKATKSDKKASKLKMGGYLEPDKELMFGGKSKYQAGGMAPTPMKPKKKMEMPASMQTPGKKKPMGLMDKMKDAVGKSKYKSGGFPDLNKDGKITKADILKGRGVIKEAGGMMEECGPGRPCYNAKKAARTARKQERARRNPNAARRRAANSGGGGGAGIGGALKTVAGLGALGFMAKKAKDSM